MRRSARIMTMAGCGLACLALVSGCGLLPSSKTLVDDQTVPSVRTVQLDQGSGNVTVRAEPTATAAAIHRTIAYRGDQPGPSVRVQGDAVLLGNCGRLCSVDYLVVVPVGTAVTGALDSGDTDVTGVSSATVSVGSGRFVARDVPGAVDVRSDSGDVTLANIGANIAVRLGSGNVALDRVRGDATLGSDSGDVRGTGLGGKVSIRAGSGNIRLDLDQPKDVHVKVDSGDIDLALPQGPYRVDAASDSGRVRTEVTNDPGAGQLLELRAGSGNVTARYR